MVSALLLSSLLGCSQGSDFRVSPPLLLAQAEWGPLLRNVSARSNLIANSPVVNNLGGPPLLIERCTLAPDPINAELADRVYSADGARCLASADSSVPLIGACAIRPALPAGLIIASNGRNCLLSGTPTGLSEMETYTVTARNLVGSDSVTVSFAVVQSTPLFGGFTPIVFSGLPIAFFNLTGEELLSCDLASNSPGLPGGISLTKTPNNIGCQIGGVTAQNLATTTQTYFIDATNEVGTTQVSLEIEFLAVSPIITVPSEALSFEVGVPSTQTIAVTGSQIDMCEAVDDLPDGLSIAVSLDKTMCIISGTASMVTPQQNYNLTTTNSIGSTSRTVPIVVVAKTANLR